MGKTRDLFKKIRDTTGIFHAKMGSIKDRNGMDLTEAEDIKKRWQDYTEELYKKDLHDPDNHDDVITNLEQDILESEVPQSCPTLCDPWTTRLLCPWDFPGNSTGVDWHFLLHGVFLTQGSNPGFLHCRQTLYHLSHQRSLCWYVK